jgi:hypothetical protein
MMGIVLSLALIAFMLAVFCAVSIFVIRGLREDRQWARVKSGRCHKCGYDLRVNLERCPECGEPIQARTSWNELFGLDDEDFDSTATQALLLSHAEAFKHGFDYVGTGHLLAGIASVDGSLSIGSCPLVTEDLESLRIDLRTIAPPGPTKPPDRWIPSSPAAQRAVEFAVQRCREEGASGKVGLKHLLAGLQHERLSVAGEYLATMVEDPDSCMSTA